MTFKVFSLGCKVNSYECSAISSLLVKEGFILSSDETADIIILNTCSVTATADQKSRQKIRHLKKKFPNAIIVVMGCYSQGNVDYIKNELEVDICVGTSNRNMIPTYIKRYIENKEKIIEIDNKTRFFSYEELGITSNSENIRAYLKIQDGCDNFCSYCLIPLRRGKSRSRKLEDVIAEGKYLISQGYQEIVLTGIHLGGYGQDLEGVKFADVVRKLSDLPGLNSLRISSIEESEITEELIELIKTRKNIAKHLHMPLQSGSKTVLERMHRKYDTEAYYRLVKHIQEEIPNIAITTDVIVGFPGESEEEFLETYNFIKKCGINMLHVFPFSAREGTLAYVLKDQIAPNVKEERVHRLLDLSNALWDDYQNRFLNQEVEVLIEEYDAKEHINKGHTTNYLSVEVKSDHSLVGKTIKTTFTKV